MTQSDNSVIVVSSPAKDQSEKDETLNILTETPVVHHKLKRRILLTGLSISMMTSTLTGPALASSVGMVALDLKDYENMSWYLTTFLLCSAVSQLLSIRISDCLGRRRVYLFSIMLMSVSSLGSGLSINSYMLIVFRIFQGACGGVIITLSTAVLIDLFPMEQRLSYLSNNSIAYGISSTAGPLIGGVLSDKLSWRYIFGLNVILTIPPCIIIYLYLELPTKPEQRISRANFSTLFSRIDAVGCVIVSAGIVTFLLSMNLGSTSLKYSWSSPLVIGLLAASFASFVAFIVYEKCVALAPLFPAAIITNRNIALIYTQQFINGFYYITITVQSIVMFQAVYNDTPTIGSLKLIAPIVAFTVFTLIQSKVTKKLGTPKPALIGGNLLLMLSILLLMFVQTENSNTGIQIGLLVLYGFGFGFANQATTIGSQLILEEAAPHMVPASTALTRFLLQAGFTISTAIFFSFMNAEVKSSIESLRQTDPYLYQKVIESGSYREYVKISSIRVKEVQTILNLIYFKSISKTQYVTLTLSAIAIVCIIIVRIPKMSPKKNKETSSIDA